MKKLLPAFLFFISFTMLLGACGRDSHAVSSILLLADSLMQSRPDSSLQLLEEVSAPQKMGTTDRAWYALLLTQAKYKNYVSLVENDSPCKRFYIQKCELILEHGTEHPTK